jgi:hypothetical protein
VSGKAARHGGQASHPVPDDSPGSTDPPSCSIPQAPLTGDLGGPICRGLGRPCLASTWEAPQENRKATSQSRGCPPSRPNTSGRARRERRPLRETGRARSLAPDPPSSSDPPGSPYRRPGRPLLPGTREPRFAAATKDGPTIVGPYKGKSRFLIPSPTSRGRSRNGNVKSDDGRAAHVAGAASSAPTVREAGKAKADPSSAAGRILARDDSVKSDARRRVTGWRCARK